MNWIYFVYVLLMCSGYTLAQQGYDYSRPPKPFTPSTGHGENNYPGSSGSTTQFPGTGYPSSKPHGNGFPGPQGPYPGQGPQGSSYPGTQGPSYPGHQGSGQYPSPQGPTNQYPGSQSHTDSHRPGSYPGNHAPSGPSHHGGHGSNSENEDGHYEESFDDGDYSAIPGQPETDYPIYSSIPETSFRCDQQQFPGYYADVEARCQVFHICANDKQYDFLCPNGTIFHQEHLVCVWWNQFDCNSATSLYGINGNIYEQSTGGQHGGQGPQGPEQGYPGSGPHGPSSGYPGSGGQGPAPGYPGNGQPKPAPGYPGPQGPAPGYPGSQKPAPGYPGPQGPAPGYPGAQKPGYPSGSTGQHGSTSYPGHGSQRPDAGYPSSGTQGPGGYPSPQGPTNGGSQQPTREYLPPVNG